MRQLLDRADGLIHGSLIRMVRTCGKAGCRCALKGQKHPSWYLEISVKGRVRMKHIPKAQEATVRRWVEAYQRARTLLEEISRQAWQRLEQSKE
jgi:hypothetical protein